MRQSRAARGDIDETGRRDFNAVREAAAMSQCDRLRSDIQIMRSNGVPAGTSSNAPLGRTTTAAAAGAGAVWLCPAVVVLTAPEIAAALYAFSDLIDEVPEPTYQALRDELSFVIARYGTAMIEGVADWIALGEAASVSVFVAERIADRDRSASTDRLTWCQEHSLSLLSAEAA